MGCCKFQHISQQEEPCLPTAERVLDKAEAHHPFSKVAASHLIKEFLVNSRHGIISFTHLRRACRNLGFACEMLMEDRAFFQSLLTTSDGLSTDRLVLSSILLGQGSSDEKFEVWFEYVDPQALELLSKVQFIGYLNALLSVALTIFETLSPVSDAAALLTFQEAKTQFINKLASEAPPMLERKDLRTLDFFSVFDLKSLRALLRKSHEPFAVTQDVFGSPITRVKCLSSPPGETYSISTELGQQLESESMSDESKETIGVQVQLEGRVETFVVLADDDMLQRAEEFAALHQLSDRDKAVLLASVKQIEEAN